MRKKKTPTPQPWHFHRETDPEAKPPAYFLDGDGGHAEIGVIETLADVRLIVEAPAMYELLRAVGPGGLGEEEFKKWHRHVRAVLARIDGKRKR